jgi:hypothetical protein
MNTFIYYIQVMCSTIKEIMQRSYALALIGSVIVLFTGSVAFASTWTGPTQVFPNGNVAAPINESATAQVKNGNIAVNGLAVFGNTLLGGVGGSNAYLNFGATAGLGGYGFRDNAGSIEYKNSGSTWAPIGGGAASQWTTSGSNIYYTGGNVGVDTTNPTKPLDVTGVIRGSDDIISTSVNSDGANIRMIGGNYGAFFRNDGANTYFLLTATGNQYGAWNGLRPFTVDDVTGKVNLASGALVAGGLTSDTIQSPQYCIGASCITSWPSGGSSYTDTDTLDSVTTRGNTTANNVQVNGITANNEWFRANGNYGLYFNTWGGGWQMTDATWLRSVNNKNIYTLNVMRADGGFCIGGSCITTWPSAYNNTDTLDTVTARGGSTSNGISVGGINSNGNINVTGRIGAYGKSATSGYPSGWSGGVHTFDLYAEGTVGVGPSGGPAKAWMDNAGNGHIGGQFDVQNALNLSGNQMWTNTGTLYLQYSGVAGSNVTVGGQTGVAQSLIIPNGNLELNNGTINGLPGGVGVGNVNTGWYSDGNNLAVRPANGTGGDFFVQSPGGATTYMLSGAGAGGTHFISGNVFVDNSIYASAFLYNSDVRLKKDIHPLSGTLEKVLAIEPVTYYWKDPSRGFGLQIGFIAQNVQKVAPEIVHTDASTTLLSIDYARTTPLLVGAVQELNQKISDQQSEIDAQQHEIDRLESEIDSLKKK